MNPLTYSVLWEAFQTTRNELIQDFQSNRLSNSYTEISNKPLTPELECSVVLVSATKAYETTLSLLLDELLFCEISIPGLSIDRHLAESNLELFEKQEDVAFFNPGMEPFLVWFNTLVRDYESFLAEATRGLKCRDLNQINYYAVCGTQKIKDLIISYMSIVNFVYLIGDKALFEEISSKREKNRPFILNSALTVKTEGNSIAGAIVYAKEVADSSEPVQTSPLNSRVVVVEDDDQDYE